MQNKMNSDLEIILKTLKPFGASTVDFPSRSSTSGKNDVRAVFDFINN